MDATLKSNIEKNTAVIEEQEQTKRQLTERIEQFENDPNYSEPSREEGNISEVDPSEVDPSEVDPSEVDPSEEEPLQFSNPAFGLDEPVPAKPSPTSIETTTTEIGPGKNGVQEILVRIQYPIAPPGKVNPGPVMALKGDTSVSTEAAVVGVMDEQSSVVAAEEENALLGGQKSKQKHKTTRRKKQSYFTKDDFIAF
jgi:hypothetical protein